LESIFDINHFFDSLADDLAEIVLDRLFDDKNGLVEPGFQCVIDREFEDDLAVRSYRLDLLQTAEAAAHAGCHYKKCHVVVHFYYSFCIDLACLFGDNDPDLTAVGINRNTGDLGIIACNN